MNPGESTAFQEGDNLNRKLQIAHAFIRDILGRTEPVETSAEVLDFLILESGRFVDGATRKQKLLSARKELSTRLEAEILNRHKWFSTCGIDDANTKFDSLEAASCFAGSTTTPTIPSLALSYVEDFEDLKALECSYQALSHKSQDLQTRSLHISQAARTTAIGKLERMEQDVTDRTIATKKIQEQANRDRRPMTNIKLPSLDCKVVQTERQRLNELQEELNDREIMLTNIHDLPDNIDHIALEIDRLQRHLQKLEQHRSDLYRSIRR